MRTLISSAFLVMAAASSVSAAPVLTNPMHDGAPEADLVESFLGEGVYETVMVDLNGSGSATDIVVRVGEDCSAGVPCRTVVIRPGREDWEIVFDRTVSDIETGEPGFGAVQALVVDGGQTWRWTSAGYRLDVQRSGDPVEMSLVPADYVDLLLAEFGSGAVSLFEADDRVSLDYAVFDLASDGGDELIVRLEGPGVCGRVLGCPIRILRVAGERYETLLEGFASGDIALTGVTRDGWRDVLTELPSGFAVYGWSGEGYAQAELVTGE